MFVWADPCLSVYYIMYCDLLKLSLAQKSQTLGTMGRWTDTTDCFIWDRVAFILFILLLCFLLFIWQWPVPKQKLDQVWYIAVLPCSCRFFYTKLITKPAMQAATTKATWYLPVWLLKVLISWCVYGTNTVVWMRYTVTLCLWDTGTAPLPSAWSHLAFAHC